MKTLLAAVVLATVLAGCGDAGSDDRSTVTASSSSPSGCVRGGEPDVELARPDLDGDGEGDVVSFSPASGECPGGLRASVPGLQSAPSLDWDPAPTPWDAWVVAIPGRTGELLVVLQQHPRGGFQAHLFGYADARLEELTADGQPVFPFVATDVTSTPLAATCVTAGFEVTQARTHEPVGLMPAWDVDRTTYTVAGNTVTKGATTEVADNVLDERLRATYRGLVDHSLFEDCRADS